MPLILTCEGPCPPHFFSLVGPQKLTVLHPVATAKCIGPLSFPTQTAACSINAARCPKVNFPAQFRPGPRQRSLSVSLPVQATISPRDCKCPANFAKRSTGQFFPLHPLPGDKIAKQCVSIPSDFRNCAAHSRSSAVTGNSNFWLAPSRPLFLAYPLSRRTTSKSFSCASASGTSFSNGTISTRISDLTRGGRLSPTPIQKRGRNVFATNRSTGFSGIVPINTPTPLLRSRRKTRHCANTLRFQRAFPRVKIFSCGENSKISSAQPAYLRASPSVHAPTNHVTFFPTAHARNSFNMGVICRKSPKCPGAYTTISSFRTCFERPPPNHSIVSKKTISPVRCHRPTTPPANCRQDARENGAQCTACQANHIARAHCCRSRQY